MSELIIFTGPPGAGKSSAGETFTATSDETWAYIDQDEIRNQIKAGFRNPSDPWDEQTQTQWDVSIGICGDMAKRYQINNINCLIDCFMPPHAFDKWSQVFNGLKYNIVVLLPNLEVALERNSMRNGAARLSDDQVRRHHEWFTGYHDDGRVEIIDSSTLSVHGVGQALAHVLRVRKD